MQSNSHSIIFPSSIFITLPHCSATAKSWVTITIVFPCLFRSINTFIISFVVSVSSAPVGSSAKINAGSFCNRSSNCNALLLTPGKITHRLIDKILHLHHFKHFCDFFPVFFRFLTSCCKIQRNHDIINAVNSSINAKSCITMPIFSLRIAAIFLSNFCQLSYHQYDTLPNRIHQYKQVYVMGGFSSS